MNDVVGSLGFSANYMLLIYLQSELHQLPDVKDQNDQSLFLGTLLLYGTYINHIFVLTAATFLIDKHVVYLKSSKTTKYQKYLPVNG